MPIAQTPVLPGSSLARAPLLPVYASVTMAFFGASSAPTPLYTLYQSAWGFSSGMLTLVFAVYAFALLAALLTTGALSDHLGRRPVVLGALALEAVAMLVFAGAGSVGWLIAARVLQGFATGVVASALGAALLDAHRTRGALVNTIAPILGMAAGALGAGALVQYAPAPLQLVYGLLFVLFLLQVVLVLRLPESVTPQPGALASLRPRVRVPQAARGALLQVAPICVAVWALGGFYLSLGPTLARAVTGSHAPTIGGWVVTALTTSGALAVLLLRHWTPRRLLLAGAGVLAVGLLCTLAAVHVGHAAGFFAGTALAGVGFGIAFQGALRTVLPLAEAHERAGLMAAIYVLCYLAFSLPALLAGVLVHHLGLQAATDSYAAVLVALAATTVLLRLRGDPPVGPVGG